MWGNDQMNICSNENVYIESEEEREARIGWWDDFYENYSAECSKAIDEALGIKFD